MNGTDTIAATLSQLMATDSAVHVLGEALPLSGAAAPLLAAHPDRCYLLPAADATLLGLGLGLAIAGAKPVVELSGPDALWGALQQIGQEGLALRGEFGGTLVVRVPLGPEERPPLEVLSGLEHVTIVSPASPADAGALLTAAIRHTGITVMLEPLLVLAEEGGLPGDATGAKASTVQTGEHVTIAAWGGGVEAALSAARTLGAEGIRAEVVDLRYLSPLDTQTLAASVHKTGRLVIVDGSAAMLRKATESSFLRLESPPALAGHDQIITLARAAVQF